MVEQAGAADRRFVVRLSSRGMGDDEVLSDLADVARRLGRQRLTRAEYDRHGSFSSSMIVRRVGSWKTACERVGLRTGRPDLGHPESVWMQNIADIWMRLGRQPSYGDLRGSQFSPEGYAKRYGSWTDALRTFEKWIASEGDELAAELTSSSAEAQPPSGRRRSPNLRQRWKVMERDRFSCRACGRSPATEPDVVLHVDHMVPFSKGGETVLANLQTLCDRCNYGKADDGPETSPIG